jgi:AcrR family transcriptional regulator
MDSPSEQERRKPDRGRGSEPTRERLLDAAALQIAEVGWGRVTTRSVADRAGLPHGAVSYHFAGKQELLAEAAVRLFEQAFPLAELEAVGSLDALIGLIERWMAEAEGERGAVAEVGIEAMLESARDPELRRRLAEVLAAYREQMVRLAEADAARGAALGGASPAAVATLLAALGDGLFLHSLLDPELDAAQAMAALRQLLR